MSAPALAPAVTLGWTQPVPTRVGDRTVTHHVTTRDMVSTISKTLRWDHGEQRTFQRATITHPSGRDPRREHDALVRFIREEVI